MEIISENEKTRINFPIQVVASLFLLALLLKSLAKKYCFCSCRNLNCQY